MSENQYDEEQKTGDPLSLGVVDQSVFALQCFEKGATAVRFAERFKDETSLAQAYFLFFRQMKWIEGDNEGQWRLSDKGKETLALLKSPEKKK